MSRERFEGIVSRLHYKGWRFVVGQDGSGGRCYLQIAFNAPHSETGDLAHWTGRKWWLSAHMTLSEVVQTAWAAVEMAEIHEARERFLFDGEAIFGPHLDVEKLVGFVKTYSKDKRI